MKKVTIDINCDMGESYGAYTIGNDAQVMQYITSCNIACGFHGGDPYQIEKTIDLALEKGVNIGAHPSYPDLGGFGRRFMAIPRHELSSIIKYQVCAIKALVESKGGQLSHVKPHGALYNRMAIDSAESDIVLSAVAAIDVGLPVMLMASSEACSVAIHKGAPFVSEAFIDRRYESVMQLASRSNPNSVIQDPVLAYQQLKNMIIHNQIECIDGSKVSITADSYCIHGDNPAALSILEYVHERISKEGLFDLNQVSP